ncbi:MAG: trypsin-like serine peptidase [Paracoccaceae bacterium]
MKIFTLILAFWTLLATPIYAEDGSKLKALMTGNDSRGWEAVGRLNIGGQAFCTGALIAPDLVLTAAHCLFDKASGRQYRNDEIEFLAGWRNGRANAYRGIRRALAHPDFDFYGGDRISRIANDVAILQLDQPVKSATISPFATGVRPRKGAEVGVVSYGQDRSETPSLQEVCHVLARNSGTLVLSCDVDFGSSGAPIFDMDADGNPKIVSVISAKADVRGRMVALGTSLEAPLEDLMALLASTDAQVATPLKPVARILTLSGSNRDSGAKFLRP